MVEESVQLLEPVVYGDRITRLVDPEIGMAVEDVGRRECVLAMLNSDSALVEALGEQPKTSGRFGDLRRVADQCEAAESTANDLVGIFARHGKGPLVETKRHCLSEALGRYPASEREEVLRSEIVNVPAGALRDRVRELLAICGLDTSMVPSG